MDWIDKILDSINNGEDIREREIGSGITVTISDVSFVYGLPDRSGYNNIKIMLGKIVYMSHHNGSVSRGFLLDMINGLKESIFNSRILCTNSDRPDEKCTLHS